MKSAKPALDLRMRRTYKFLWDALMTLMKEEDFESISVTEICERAMVHRTTFYKHYEDKNGLLFHGIQDELNSLFETVDLAVANAPSDEHRMRLIAVFEHVRNREGFYRLMLCGAGFANFSTLLRKSLAERLMLRMQDEGAQIEMPLSLHADLQAAGIVTAVAWWLDKDCSHTISEMIDYLVAHFQMLPSSQHRSHKTAF